MAGYKLQETEIIKALVNLPGWTVKEGKLHKEYKFTSFSEAMGWMVNVGIQAEAMGHHPEWFNVYNLVSVTLITYDLGHVISNLDIELAKKMEAVFNR
ncbi:4a-hydroxytetrahydrobiopterin dehydratase [Anabaena sp. UHCC 0204]|uniref:4a-hydroxytetrahydrobiopterin dehydratase n=1 Tax=Anabaena sp. UHCC 0204 TaxID=2590009 RepID=UPI0014480ACA|nr:4a-hydroxytetrahydrobiopterin dehydratase [Anabaena sp. UHCC 0204]MTJ09076.1 4a-hydroxytetrahydrobiopterin dehydratase [Anabaena sp. UHCC 0204]